MNPLPNRARLVAARCRSLILVCAATLLCAASLYAQTVTGTLQGTITDPNGAVIPGATITIINTDTGLERTLTSSDEGFYVSANLPLGSYRVSAALANFATTVRENVEITLNRTEVADFQLSPSITGGEVIVTASEAPINTTNGEVKQSLESQQILDKPTINPSNFLSLAETFTGFQENPTGGQNNPTASAGSSVSFNGTGTRGTTFQINGVSNDDSSENQNRQGAALSTIKEFQVITNNFTAEFGRGFGAVVLVQTKSGTNNIDGDVYYFHNNSALNAASAFIGNAQKPVNRKNQYGGTVGLPFIKNKLFGFASFDQQRFSGADPNPYRRDLFTAAELAKPRLTRGNDTPANRAFIQSIIDRYPSTLAPGGFLNTTIAATPTVPVRTLVRPYYVGSIGIDRPLDDYSGRLDWNPRQSDTVFARYQYTRQIFDNEDIIVGEATRQNNKQQNVGVTWTHLFTQNTVGEFRYGLGLRTTLVGIKAGDDTPIVRFAGTNVFVSTTLGNAGAFPINRYQTDNQFVYNVSTLFGGNHFFKAGTDIRRQKLDDLAQSFARPFYTFRNGLCAGVNYDTPYDAFLDGCVASFERTYGNFFLKNRINESNFYAEDNWKVTPNLTLNLGARYEYVNAPEEADNLIDYFFDDDKNNIEPRVAIAYSPGFERGFLAKLTGGPNNSSIRAGYGIYHGRLFQSVFSQPGASVRTNVPNALRQAFNVQTANGSNFFPNSLNVSDPFFGFNYDPSTAALVRRTETRIDPNLEVPYTQQWSLTVERQTPLNSAVRITYTGNRGIGLPRIALGNLPVSPLDGGIVVPNSPNNAPAAGAPDLRGVLINRIAADVQCAGTGFIPGVAVNAQCPNRVPIANNEVSLRVPRTNERRPDPNFLGVSNISNGVWTYYHGLQVEWNKRLSRGLQYQAAYTFSKSIDTTSDAAVTGVGDTNQTGNSARLSRGLARTHTPHRFTFNGSYLLPFFSNQEGFVGQLLGGWQLSTVVRIAHGTPFTVFDTAGIDLNFDGFAESRPVLLDPSVLGRSVGNPNNSVERLPREAFRRATPADFAAGNLLGRNTFYLDGTETVDFGFYKNFRLPFEGQRLTFRAELYNAFNHVQYGFPNTDIASGNFGLITTPATLYTDTNSSVAPRRVQFALRYQF